MAGSKDRAFGHTKVRPQRPPPVISPAEGGGALASQRSTSVGSGSVSGQVGGGEPAQQFIPADIFYPAEGQFSNGGGATGEEVHRGSLSWANPDTGDYAGANGLTQASATPYATTGTIVSGAQISLPVTQLVAEWVNGTHQNHGFMLRRVSGTASSAFHSKEAANSAQRPTLSVTTAGGTTVFNVESDTHCSVDGINAQGTSVTLTVSTGFAVIRFNLSSIAAGTVLSANLILTPSISSVATIGVFRINLDPLQAAIPFETGVANAYLFDSGLGSDPEVVMFEDFSDFPLGMASSSNALAESHGWTGILNAFTPPAERPGGNYSEGDEQNATIVGDTDPEDPNFFPLFPGAKFVKFKIGHLGQEGKRLNNALSWRWPLYGNLGAIWESHNVARGAMQDINGTHYPEEPEEIYIRCQFMLGNWKPRAVTSLGVPTPGGGGKWINGTDSTYNNSSPGNVGLVGPILKANAPPFTGNGGLKSYTCSGWSYRQAFAQLPVGGNDTPLIINGYRKINGEAEDWSSVEEGALDSNSVEYNSLALCKEYTHHTHELRIKLNSIDTTGATKAFVGYPWGGLYSNINGGSARPGAASVNPPAGIPPLMGRFNSNDAGTVVSATASEMVISWPAVTGDNATKAEAINARETLHYFRNYALRSTTTPTEFRRVNGYTPGSIDPVTGAGTGTFTIDSHDGSPATWTTLPLTGQTGELIANTVVKERTTLFYGNAQGHIYADGNALLYGTHSGLPTSLRDTVITQSAGIGRRDGIRETFIDGRKTHSETNVWFRSIPNVQVQSLWYPPFMGGSGPIPEQEIWCYFGQVVASKSYIGPTRLTAVEPPSEVPSWVTNLPLNTQHEILNTNLENNYPLSSKNYPGNIFDERAALGCESGLVCRTADSRLITSTAGGHADWSGNITLSKGLETETPGGMWEVDHPGSDPLIVPTGSGSGGSPSTGVTHYQDGLPTSAHTYDRVHFIQSEDRLVRMQATAVWAQGSPTFPSCDSFQWSTKTWDAAGTIPDLPVPEGANQAIQASSCKDPLTEDVFIWWNTQIWKWTRATNSWGAVPWKTVTAIQAKPGQNTGMATNGTTEIVTVKGGAAGTIQIIDFVTRNYSEATVTGSGAAGFQNVGTRCVMEWDPDLTRYIFMPGNQNSATRSTIYTLQNQSGTWVGEALITLTPALPAYFGPAKRLVRIPKFKGYVFAQDGQTNLKFFRVA